MGFSVRRVLAFLAICAGLLAAVPGPSVSGAPTTGCLDWRDYASDMAPAGSGNLGLGSTPNSQAAGSVITLTDILGRNVDLRISWANSHDGQILDEGLTADFNGVGDYLAAVGGPNTQTVFRYFPKDDDRGQITFEFLEGGTTSPALVQVDHLLIGGQRKFSGVGWGTQSGRSPLAARPSHHLCRQRSPGQRCRWWCKRSDRRWHDADRATRHCELRTEHQHLGLISKQGTPSPPLVSPMSEIGRCSTGEARWPTPLFGISTAPVSTPNLSPTRKP